MSLTVWSYDAQAVALSYPHYFISRFEQGVDEIILYDGRMLFVRNLIGWFTQRLDDDAIIVVGYPDFSIASLGNIRDTCGKGSGWDVRKSRNFLVEECFTCLSIVQGYAVWIQSQPEIFAIGSEYGIYVVDGEMSMTGIEIPEFEQRRLGVNLQNTVVLRTEPDVAFAIGSDVVVEVERVVADRGISFPFSIRHIFFEIAHTFSGTCPERFCYRVVYYLIEGIKMVGAIRVLMHFRLSHISRIVQTHYAISPGSHPQVVVLVEEEGVGGIGGVESGIAVEGVASTAEAHESCRPGADEQVAVSVFYDGFHAIAGHFFSAAILINEPCFLFIIGIERLGFGIEVGESAISSNP